MLICGQTESHVAQCTARLTANTVTCDPMRASLDGKQRHTWPMYVDRAARVSGDASTPRAGATVCTPGHQSREHVGNM